jgi:hypothetical protein
MATTSRPFAASVGLPLSQSAERVHEKPTVTAPPAFDYRTRAPISGARSTILGARTRKFIGLIALLGFMFAYVIAAITVADRLPENTLVQLAYFVVVGSCWFIPIIPLVRWMNWGRAFHPRQGSDAA